MLSTLRCLIVPAALAMCLFQPISAIDKEAEPVIDFKVPSNIDVSQTFNRLNRQLQLWKTRQEIMPSPNSGKPRDKDRRGVVTKARLNGGRSRRDQRCLRPPHHVDGRQNKG